jgi:hypothetical protein
VLSGVEPKGPVDGVRRLAVPDRRSTARSGEDSGRGALPRWCPSPPSAFDFFGISKILVAAVEGRGKREVQIAGFAGSRWPNVGHRPVRGGFSSGRSSPMVPESAVSSRFLLNFEDPGG